MTSNSAASTTAAKSSKVQFQESNQVRLVGRVSDEVQERELPSGVTLTRFRLVVSREKTAMTAGSKVVSDWFECSAWSAKARRTVRGFKQGQVVEVVGAVRRRHFKGANAIAGSVVEIEVMQACVHP